MKKRLLIVLSLVLIIPFMASAAVNKRPPKTKDAAQDGDKPLASLKKVVAVADFDVENVGWGSDVAMNLGDMLVDKLVNTGKFIVVERDRKAVDLTLARAAEREQGAKQAGMSRGSGSEAGKAMAAQALFVGTVTGIGKGSSFGGGGGGWGDSSAGLGGLGISSNKVSVVVRWYDTTSLEIKGSKECSGSQSFFSLFGGGGGAGSDGGGAGAGGGTFRSTLATTFSKALDKCVAWIVSNMEKLPWEGKIISVKGNQIYLNAGSDAGVNIGDSFTVAKVGEELVDPDSGMSLGVEETLSGEIQVAKVMPKFSIATITSGGGFRKGDVVRGK